MDWDSFTGIFAVFLIFGMPVFIVGIVFVYLFRSHVERQKTLRMAIEKSDSLPPEFLDTLKSLQKRPHTPANDVRAGLVLIAVALGLVALDLSQHSFVLSELSGVAAIPGFIGLALLILGIVGIRKA